MPDIVKIAKENYTEIQHYNIELRKEKEWLQTFYWHCWLGLLPEKRAEQINYVRYIIENKVSEIDPTHRHNFAVEIMLEAGWTLGPVKRLYGIDINGKFILVKTDPFLIPWEYCSGEFKRWGEARDKITMRNTKDYL